ncbi:MAG: endonuclease/exonuclease/phosphatase family protein [Flavobacteriaceae bacterium]|jgi:endonuclease/exonuclease/phosphatase family metal-dependent hydrolase
MKKSGFGNKIIVFINTILALLLLFSYLLPFISPKSSPGFTVLSLAVPLLFLLNLLFAIYWIVQLKKYFIISAVIIILGFGYISSIVKFTEKKILLNDDIKVMSYNVRMFNHYKWTNKDAIAEKASQFIAEKKPDILTIQEFYEAKNLEISYPYKYIKTKSKTNKFGLAIYSNYQIINSGSLNLKNSANNIIFADVLKGTDTIRVYNIHLESLKINPDKQNFGEKNSDRLLRRIKASFQKQAAQVEQFLAHEKEWKGKKIICGDFNNTAFSWVYRQIKKDKQDAFKIAGKGMGKTFNYLYPMRIDFILPDNNFDVNNFKTFDVEYSDHFPILARIKLKVISP